MDVSTQIDATNFSSQPTAAAMGQAIPQNHFSLMVGQLRAHSLHPDYLPHSTTKVGVHIQQTPRHATETVVVV